MRITLPSGTPAEIATPTSGSASLGLVIAVDIFGLRPLYDEMAQRLADEWNMTVCAVEPFPGRDLGNDFEARYRAVRDIGDDDNLRDLVEAADATGCATVNLLGYCLGGMYCHKAARSDRFARIVSFYGMIRLPEAWQGAGQAEPLGILHNGHSTRVLAIVGGLDTYTPAADVDALVDTGVTVVLYPEASHAFAHDATHQAHRRDDAVDAYDRALQWLRAHA